MGSGVIVVWFSSLKLKRWVVGGGFFFVICLVMVIGIILLEVVFLNSKTLMGYLLIQLCDYYVLSSAYISCIAMKIIPKCPLVLL